MKIELKSIRFLCLLLATLSVVSCTNTQIADSTTKGVDSAVPEISTTARLPDNVPETPVTDETPPMIDQRPSVSLKDGELARIAAYDPETADYQMRILASSDSREISDTLLGIFIEDINFAADGGLYAELIKNRSFEFTTYAAGDEKHGWSDVGVVSANVQKGTDDCLNANNPNYMLIQNTSDAPAGIANKGFLGGIAVEKGKQYLFSVYAKAIDAYGGPLNVSLTQNGKTIANAKIDELTDHWKKYEIILTPETSNDSGTYLELTIDKGSVAVDMVSLFPKDTYKGRENGLRADLMERIAALNPSFIRFPGGCVIEGFSLDTAYSWKDSIGADANGQPYLWNGVYGDVAARKMGINYWTDKNATEDQHPAYMTYGLGFYEYFLMAEDLGALGIPVVNCGMSNILTHTGEIAPIGSAEMQRYIQDALDLVEFCRGGTDTKWGAVRAAMGHPEPFELKYVGIGNEQFGNDFYEHYIAFVEAFIEARENNPALYGDIELIFTSGVFSGDNGVQYIPAYEAAEKWLEENPHRSMEEFAGLIDHHYYNDPQWFLDHVDYYDEKNYSRDELTETKFCGGIPVFLGEFAARSNTLEAALAEAAYMTGLERNADVVRLAAYAPLLGNRVRCHWSPDMIWFSSYSNYVSANYYVQKIFGTNIGDRLLESVLEGARIPDSTLVGKIGLGTWNTAARFDNVKVVSNQTGEVLGGADFTNSDDLAEWEMVSDGNWLISKGQLLQTSTSTNIDAYFSTGSAMYFGNTTWSDYTFTVDATKTSGAEGFLIAFSVGDKNNNFFWNVGGWGNTNSCLQRVKNGIKSDRITETSRDLTLQTNRTYQLKVVVTPFNIKCYIDGELYVDYDVETTTNATAYQVVSKDKNGDIIVKLVNVTDSCKTFAIDIADMGEITGKATVEVVYGNKLTDENFGTSERIKLERAELDGLTDHFNFTVKKYSVTVLRIKAS